ncbi:MAG: cadmium-translocating P-type ATPase, partial [Chloroflexi bacterium]|nr:cadmium-translocating P-type ATPase [Chloroflexota bacterium]
MEEKRPLKTWKIKGLDCPDCAASLEKAVQALPQVDMARLTYSTSSLMVKLRDGQGEGVDDSVRELVESMGYELAQEKPGERLIEPWYRRLWRRRRDVMTVISGVLLVIALVSGLVGAPLWATNALYAGAIVIGGFHVAKAGWIALRTAHSLDMNVLMTIAAVGAMAVNEFAEGAVTILLFSIGELLESYSADRARRAIEELMELTPDEATLLRDGEGTQTVELRVPVEAVNVGDLVIVRPGERVPVDGIVAEGRSSVDQSPITGESIPVEKALGDEVFAGTINGGGVLVVRATRPAGDSTLARIRRLVEEAQADRSPAQRFVDRFARVYTPIVVGVAFILALLPPLLGLGTLAEWTYRALVLLVIACPCALVISTPVTIVSALARAARAGVLIKGGRYLEALGALRVVAFDKTGTVTWGKPQVIQSVCELHPDSWAQCAQCEDLIAKAAAVEERSEHALAQAVLQHAAQRGLRDRFGVGEQVVATAGMGIEGLVKGHKISVGSHAFCHRNGEGHSELCDAIQAAEERGLTVLVIQDECCGNRCYLAVADTLREGMPQVTEALKRLGVERTVMVTGDNPHIAKEVALQAGIDEVHAGLLPQDKVNLVA